MKGENGQLFDLREYAAEDPGRKKPETEAERRLREIGEFEERDYKNLRNKLFQSGKPLTAAEAKRLQGYRAKFEAMAGGDLPVNVVTSKAAVGRHFGKVKRTIINWAKRGMPTRADGYDLVEIGRWALAEGLIHDASLVPSDDTPGEVQGDVKAAQPNEFLGLRSAIAELDRELKEMKVQRERGLLVERSQVAREWAARLAEVANGLEYLALRLPPLLEGRNQREMRSIIGAEVYKIRDQFARTGRFCPAPEGA